MDTTKENSSIQFSWHHVIVAICIFTIVVEYVICQFLGLSGIESLYSFAQQQRSLLLWFIIILLISEIAPILLMRQAKLKNNFANSTTNALEAPLPMWIREYIRTPGISLSIFVMSLLNATLLPTFIAAFLVFNLPHIILKNINIIVIFILYYLALISFIIILIFISYGYLRVRSSSNTTWPKGFTNRIGISLTLFIASVLSNVVFHQFNGPNNKQATTKIALYTPAPTLTLTPSQTVVPTLTPNSTPPPSPKNCSPDTFKSGDPQYDIDICLDFVNSTAKAGSTIIAYTYVIQSHTRMPMTGFIFPCALSTTFNGIPDQNGNTNKQAYIIWNINIPANASGTAFFYVNVVFNTPKGTRHVATWNGSITITP